MELMASVGAYVEDGHVDEERSDAKECRAEEAACSERFELYNCYDMHCY